MDILKRRDQAGLYAHLKQMDLKRRKTVNSQYDKDDDDNRLHDPIAIHAQCVRFFRTVSNARSYEIVLSITERPGRVPVNCVRGGVRAVSDDEQQTC